MKIISKYKDYYDYVAGIYGIDPKLVLDRRTEEDIVARNEFSTGKVRFYICGKYVEGLQIRDKVYFGEKLLEFGEIDRQPSWRSGFSDGHTRVAVNLTKLKDREFHDPTGIEYFLLEPKDTDVNDKENCPILMGGRFIGYFKYPILESFNLASVFPPEEIFLMLSSWLSKKITEKELVVDSRTDTQKLESKGFDKVVSFRPKSRSR